MSGESPTRRGPLPSLPKPHRPGGRLGRNLGRCASLAGRCQLAGRDQVAALEVVEDLLRRLLGRLLVGLDGELGVLRRLVGVRDAGELLDLAGARLGVKALDVALLADLERGLGVDLDEPLAHLVPCLVADVAVGRDRSGDNRDAVAREQVGDEGDAADVGVAVLLRETEALGQVLADDVAVEYLELGSAAAELLHQLGRDRGLPRAGEAGEPETESLLGCHQSFSFRYASMRMDATSSRL